MGYTSCLIMLSIVVILLPNLFSRLFMSIFASYRLPSDARLMVSLNTMPVLGFPCSLGQRSPLPTLLPLHWYLLKPFPDEYVTD